MATIPEHCEKDYGDLFAEERRVLLALLGDLSEKDWNTPTGCPGWSVLDLACHLLGDDLGVLARQRDGHFGTRPPLENRSDDDLAVWIDALQDAWVRTSRRLSPRLVVDLLAWTGPQVVEMFAGQDLTERTASVSWASRDPVPRWLDQARELSEHWIHRQQIQSALGRPADTNTATAEAVLDALRWAYPYRLQSLQARDGDTVDIVVTGAIERRWPIQNLAGTWQFVDALGGQVVARAVFTSGEAWRLLTNNMPVAEQSRLDVRGDSSVVNVLLRTRAIVGIPNCGN